MEHPFSGGEHEAKIADLLFLQERFGVDKREKTTEPTQVHFIKSRGCKWLTYFLTVCPSLCLD